MANQASIRANEVIRKFTGQFDFTLDSKGRVNIPARLREVIDLYDMQTLTLRYMVLDGFPVIRAYPTSYYNDRILGKIIDMEGETPEETYAIMLKTANCHHVKLDSQGRLNIPDDLLKKLNIQKEVRVIGMGNFFDIWNPEACDKFIEGRMASQQSNGQGK